MKIISLFLALSASLLLSPTAYAEDWFGRAARAATSLASGNTAGAAQQAVPGYGQSWNNTHVNASTGGLGVSQNLIPSQRIPATPFHLTGSYNAYSPLQRPGVNHNFNVGAGSRYVNSNVTLTPPE